MAVPKRVGSGWHKQSVRHSNARRLGRAGGKYALKPTSKYVVSSPRIRGGRYFDTYKGAEKEMERQMRAGASTSGIGEVDPKTMTRKVTKEIRYEHAGKEELIERTDQWDIFRTSFEGYNLIRDYDKVNNTNEYSVVKQKSKADAVLGVFSTARSSSIAVTATKKEALKIIQRLQKSDKKHGALN